MKSFISALQHPPAYGAMLSIGAPDIAELFALTGIDWLMVDLEHTTLTPTDVKAISQAVAGRASVVARVPWNDTIWIKQVVDCGADGVIVPQVNSAEEAKRVVDLVKYRPLGARGVGMGRAHGYGVHFNDYISRANKEVAAIIQIEHVQGVEAIDSILAVPGIDGVFLGPYDLSDSLGVRGQLDHPNVAAAVERVRKACAAKRIPAGIYAGTTEAAHMRRKEGYQFLVIGSDTGYLADGMKASLAGLKEAA